MIQEALGLNPQQTEDGSYIPSKSSLKVATKDNTNYKPEKVERPYTGSKKVMIICTEEQFMTMENGKKFKTGNQPIELFVPILWLGDAGIEVEFFTPNGKPVQLEMWAFPEDDKYVKQVYDKYKSQLERPKSFADISIENLATDYLAIFIPGGHGALLNLPENRNLGNIIKEAHEKELKILSICHGPGAFLSANLTGNQEEFIFNGYQIAAFPDSADAMLPKMGYLPGAMTWKFNEELENLGMTIVNALPDTSTHKDRNLITAAGPLAANNFGKLIIEELLQQKD